MKSVKQIQNLIGLLAVLFLAFSCEGDSGSPKNSGNRAEVEFQDSVKIVEEANIQDLLIDIDSESGSDTEKMNLKTSSDLELKVGDVIILNPDGNQLFIPVSRKIKSVRVENGQYVYETEQPEPGEVFKTLELNIEASNSPISSDPQSPLDSRDLGLEQKDQGEWLMITPSGETKKLPQDSNSGRKLKSQLEIPYAQNFNFTHTFKNGLKLDANLDIKTDIFMKGSFGEGNWKEFTYINSGKMQASITFSGDLNSVNLASSINGEKLWDSMEKSLILQGLDGEDKTGKFPIFGLAYIPPTQLQKTNEEAAVKVLSKAAAIVLWVYIDLNAQLDASGSIKSEASINYKMGFELDKNEDDPIRIIREINPELVPIDAKTGFSLSGKGGISLAGDLLITGIRPLTLEAFAGVEYEVKGAGAFRLTLLPSFSKSGYYCYGINLNPLVSFSAKYKFGLDLGFFSQSLAEGNPVYPIPIGQGYAESGCHSLNKPDFSYQILNTDPSNSLNKIVRFDYSQNRGFDDIRELGDVWKITVDGTEHLLEKNENYLDISLPTGNHTAKMVAFNNEYFTEIGQSEEKNFSIERLEETGEPGEPVASLPDFVVQSVSPTSKTVKPGENFDFSVVVKNQGKSASQNLKVNFYQSDDDYVASEDKLIVSESISAILASQRQNLEKTLSAPNNLGTYYYGVCLISRESESDSANNCSYESSSKRLVLIVSNPSSVNNGAPTRPTISYANKNYTSVTYNISGSFDYDNEQFRYQCDIAHLYNSDKMVYGSYRMNTGSDQITISNLSEGSYTIYCRAVDVNGHASESVQHNFIIDPKPQDIQQSGMHIKPIEEEIILVNNQVDASSYRDQDTEFRFQFKNNTNEKINGFSLKYYLSTDTNFDSSDSEIDDDFIGRLKKGDGEDENYDFNSSDIPTGETGTYYLGFCTSGLQTGDYCSRNSEEYITVNYRKYRLPGEIDDFEASYSTFSKLMRLYWDDENVDFYVINYQCAFEVNGCNEEPKKINGGNTDRYSESVSMEAAGLIEGVSIRGCLEKTFFGKSFTLCSEKTSTTVR